MKLTTERLKEIIKEEVTAALTEGPDRKEQLRQAIEIWMTSALDADGKPFEPENAKELAFAAKKAAKKPRWEDRPEAFQKIMDIGGPWGTGPELEWAIEDLSYEIMGEPKPKYIPQPEPRFSPSELDRFEKGEISTNLRFGRKQRG